MLSDIVHILKWCNWIPERGISGRLCSKCKLVKAFSEFNSRGGDRSHEWKNWCRMCENEDKRDKYNGRRSR